MNNFKVCLQLDDKLLNTVKTMVEQNFILVDDTSTCDVFLTDNYLVKHTNCANILVVDSTKVPEFKGVNNLAGFDHYVIFNELTFLEERVKKALFRHQQLKSGQHVENYTGVKALIPLEEITLDNGVKLPLIKHLKVTSSRDRKVMAEGLEKFFDEIEAATGYKNPVVLQYAIEIQEELLMNAIWDANPKHSKVSRSTPVDLEAHEEVTLQWAYNGKELAISVKDPFGMMEKEIMTKYINFIFKTGAEIQHNLEQKSVSAGLGMYMIVQRANLLSVFVSNGRITDVGVVLILKGGRRASTVASKAIDIIKVS